MLKLIFNFYYNQSFFILKQKIILKKWFRFFYRYLLPKEFIFFNSLSQNIGTCTSNYFFFTFPNNYFSSNNNFYIPKINGISSSLLIEQIPIKNSRVYSYIRGPHVHNKSHKQFIFQKRKQIISFFCLTSPKLLLLFLKKIKYAFNFSSFLYKAYLHMKFFQQLNYRFKGCLFL